MQLTGFKGVGGGFTVNRDTGIAQWRRGFLCHFHSPLFELGINAGDHLCRRFTDCFQRAFQLLGLFTDDQPAI